MIPFQHVVLYQEKRYCDRLVIFVGAVIDFFPLVFGNLPKNFPFRLKSFETPITVHKSSPLTRAKTLLTLETKVSYVSDA